MPYLGSKGGSGVYQAIIALMPPHDVYIETHLGGGAVMRAKPPARLNIGLDRDPAPLAAFECGYPVDLHETDAHAWLMAYPWTGLELVYADPPYLHSTRTSRHRYRFEYAEADHRELLDILRWLPCQVVVSGYPSALYDAALADWRRVQFQAMTRGGPRTEVVWMNFADAARHWASFAGKDFTDRQRIKRKAARWRAKYAALPGPERVAVLAAILGVEGEGGGRLEARRE